MGGRIHRREEGQAAVETAIVMPLMVVLVLGIIQLGLIAQARAVAKYAAYRAVRVGAMQNADLDKMQAAAVFHLLPVLPLLSSGGAETILPTTGVGEVSLKFQRAMAENRMAMTAYGPLEQVKVVICGPVTGELDNSSPSPIGDWDQQAVHGHGSPNEVDFDDPVIATEDGQAISTGGDMGVTLRYALRTKLRIQIQFHYRMPIPFANWVIARSYIGMQLPSMLRMGLERNALPPVRVKYLKVADAARQGVYVVPINVNYSMRMQSNFFMQRNRLPSSNECVTYGTP